MSEKDPDVIRWGLHHLYKDLPIAKYGETSTENDANSNEDGFIRKSNAGKNHTAVENDEIIAHALQEEFSRVAAAQAFRFPHKNEEDLQASVFAQDWCPPKINPNSGKESIQQGAEDNGPPSSCSTSSEKLDDQIVVTLELADESSILDGEVGKRLTNVVPVPHVPKINGEIPSVDEATSDHQRLLDRLRLYDLVELKVQGDGNCQFRALSDQIYRTTEHHKFVREQVLKQLHSNREIYEGYVPMAYDDYLKKMAKNGEWGDHVTLQAAADTYGVKIFVLTSFKDTCYIEIIPKVQKSNRTIFLSFWSEVHYNSIYPEGELQTLAKNKRRWWHF